MKNLFTFQLIGDFLKIGSWLLAFVMIAKAMIYTYIVTEILFAINYVLISYFLVSKFGTIGATYAFAINYLLYWVIMNYFVWKKLKIKYALLFFSDYKFALTGYTTMIINFIKGLHLLKKEIILINYKRWAYQ
jgi:hypothetical protein